MDPEKLLKRLSEIDISNLTSQSNQEALNSILVTPPPSASVGPDGDEDENEDSPFLFAPPPTRHATRGQANIEAPSFRSSASSATPGEERAVPENTTENPNSFHALFLSLDPLFSKEFSWQDLFPPSDDDFKGWEEELGRLRNALEKLPAAEGKKLPDRISLSELAHFLFVMRVGSELDSFKKESEESMETPSLPPSLPQSQLTEGIGINSDNSDNSKQEVEVGEQTIKESKARIVEEGTTQRLQDALKRKVGIELQVEVGELLIRARTLYDSDRESLASTVSGWSSTSKSKEQENVPQTPVPTFTTTQVESADAEKKTPELKMFAPDEDDEEVDTELEVARMVARGVKERIERELK
ncbi:hypothetical protein BT69DRAFT_1354116 [Atractiella rhizophila]|nr:hypothetical protein BT69DRAFT_1354116 [Atractiella rhizophila]